jgi:hypothetical protein
MKKRRTFDREVKEMVVDLSHNREDFTASAAKWDIRLINNTQKKS